MENLETLKKFVDLIQSMSDEEFNGIIAFITAIRGTPREEVIEGLSDCKELVEFLSSMEARYIWQCYVDTY